MKIITRYIASTIIKSTLIIVFILMGLEFFMNLVSQIHLIGNHHYTLITAIQIATLQMPSSIYSMFPIAGFLGSIIGLGQLANHSELIAMRAYGVSKNAILGAVLLGAIVLLTCATLIGEGVAPQLQAASQEINDIAMQHAVGVNTSTDYWLKDKNKIVHIKEVISPKKIHDITYFDFNNQTQKLTHIGHAAFGSLIGHTWYLHHVIQSNIYKQRVTTTHLNKRLLGISFNPTLSHQSRKKSGAETLKKLLTNIFYLKNSGITSFQFEYSLWKRLIQPLTSIVLICLGVPFIFGSLRDSSMGSRVMVGILIGFIFYMLNQFFGPIALIYQFPPWLSAASPTLFFVMVYFVLITRMK